VIVIATLIVIAYVIVNATVDARRSAGAVARVRG
jgi:hypothetical protein